MSSTERPDPEVKSFATTGTDQARLFHQQCVHMGKGKKQPNPKKQHPEDAAAGG